MGIFERRKGVTLKMDHSTSWLSVITILITFITQAWANEPRVVCYYTNWSVYRPGTAKFNPQNINPYLCTHLIYAFGGFTKDNTLKPFDKYQDIEKGGYAKFTGLKTYNKNLKTMLAIGGWNEGSTRFSPMVASRERRKEFVRNAIKFLRQNHFDGLDLDWEYPAFRDGGKPKDRENYAKLVKELREEFEKESEKTGKPRLLLTMAVPAGIEYIQKGFDVKTLNRYLDWMNLLTYDYHSAFEPAVNHHAPLYPLEEPNEYSVDNELNIDYTIKFYIENGADRNKLVLGIPTYGRSYTLYNPDATEIGAPADGPGEQGDATREKGYLAYYEICESLKQKEKRVKREESDEEEEDEEEEVEELPWTIVHPNPNAMGPVAYKGNQWVGYDDVEIVQKKAEYVAENGLGGIMFWSIDNDDFRGKCHDKPYPLIEAAKEAYINRIGATDNVVVTEKIKTVTSSSSRRRNRPKSTPTSKPTTAARLTQSNKRKPSPISTTPSWSTPEPPTTPDPGSDFKCTDEGFFQHPRDCKKYFWCLDSGPSNLGIVAHQFTCPSGLFFNKAADSCDFARNVFCKKSTATTKAPATAKSPVTTKATTTTTESYTTRKSIKLSTRNSLLFRTTTSTAAPAEEEQDEEDEVVSEEVEVDAEDPRVIKELIDLIKKVGGVEQLEKHLHLAESSMSVDNAGTTTPASFNKKLYQKVLERTRKNKFNPSVRETNQNSRRGPQNAGLESIQETSSLRKERPQYTTINRGRQTVSTTEEPEEVDEDIEPSRPQFKARAEDNDVREVTTKPLQYVNIRRARPTSTSDTADDSASRNSLFERQSPIVSSESPSNTVNSKRESIPEYVTIRRQRPTTEEPTTLQYESAEQEEEPSESVETETSASPSTKSQPQYISLVRSRSTTQPTPPQEPLDTPEPTTVLAVQISSLLNSPLSTIADEVPTEVETIPSPTVTEATSTTTSSTVVPRLSVPPRRTVFKRRGSTTTAPSTSTTSTTQVSSERQYAFVQRRRPLARPNEILHDLEDNNENARKIRSTTPDSREDLNIAKVEENNEKPRRYRPRYQQTKADDSVPAAATIRRGQYRPQINRDELVSLTPVDNDRFRIELKESVPRSERRFRPRTSTTAADKIEDSEVSAATVELRRPNLLPRGRSRFTLSTSTEAPKEDSPQSDRRPGVSRFTPRPFTRRIPQEVETSLDEEEVVSVSEVPRAPVRLPFGRVRPTASTLQNGVQARKLPYPLTRLSTPSIEDDNDDEERTDDISLSESTIEEMEHEETVQETTEGLPKRRKIIRKIRPSSTAEDIEPTEAAISKIESLTTEGEHGKNKFTIIRRRIVSTSTSATPSEAIPNSPTELPSSSSPRIRKIIRKILKPTLEPEIEVKTQSHLETIQFTSEPIANYGERSRPSVTTSTTSAPIIENIKEDNIQEEVSVEASKDEVDEDIETENKPQVVIETDQILDLSEDNKEPTLTEAQSTTTESTTISTTQEPTSPSARTRLPYRPSKRLFTSATEATPPSSTRTYSRKYSSRTYTSPSTVERTPETSRTTFTRKPLFNARPFSRRPYTTARTTQKVEEEEEEYESEDEEDHEDQEQGFEVLPENQFFKRRPDENNAEEDYNSQEEDEEEQEVQHINKQTKRPLFKPKVVNSNTFRTSTTTTETPKRQYNNLGSQNRTSIFNRTTIKDVDSKKRVQNVPIGYTPPKVTPSSEASLTSHNITEIVTEGDKVVTSTTDFIGTEVTTEDDDYLSYTEPGDATTYDFTSTNADRFTTNTDNSGHITTNIDNETRTDDYLEASDDTTVYPNTYSTVVEFENTSSATSEETAVTEDNNTTEGSETTETTSLPQVSPIYKTQYDKLFSVSRVVEVSSKLDKHRLNKKNESRLIEAGEVMQEKKPTVDKIGEVSRFSFIKIVEDEIPIYLTKYGHIYPVENPPDNPIRIDEARNARALNNFADVGKENLIASESINEAYRHVNNLSKKTNNNEDVNSKEEIEHLLGDDFLTFINDEKKDEKADADGLATYWQFIPAAYENEQSRQNKAAKNFEIITPRNILTDPSTLPLEGLFKTENPIASVTRQFNENSVNKQPFVVYSSSVANEKENANFVKLELLPSEGARSIKTYVKGQELNGGLAEETTIKYPVFVSVIPKEFETTVLTTVTEGYTKKSTETGSEMYSTTPITTLETEGTTVETTVVTTTETTPDETTTSKSFVNTLNENAKKRPKFAFPRRPNTKPITVTRPSTTPRAASIRKISTLSSLKGNKTSGFNPKSRFSANRAQNVPIDLKTSVKSKAKNYTAETPRPSTTERIPYYKSLRPSFRPSFVPRRPQNPSTQVSGDA